LNLLIGYTIREKRQLVPQEQMNDNCNRRDDKIAISCGKEMGNLLPVELGINGRG